MGDAIGLVTSRNSKMRTDINLSLDLDGASAANHDLLAGDRGCVRTEQKRSESGDFLGADVASDRRHSWWCAGTSRIVEHGCFGGTGGDDVHGDAFGRELGGP